jgi:hypothetical protein
MVLLSTKMYYGGINRNGIQDLKLNVVEGWDLSHSSIENNTSVWIDEYNKGLGSVAMLLDM